MYGHRGWNSVRYRRQERGGQKQEFEKGRRQEKNILSGVGARKCNRYWRQGILTPPVCLPLPLMQGMTNVADSG